MDKVLIEEGSFELVKLFHKVSEEAKKEKTAIPPTNEMLFWWTRKPLIVSRAVALTGTLRDLPTCENLLGIGKERRAFNYPPDRQRYSKSLGIDPSSISVLDPFCGSGNLVFEAKRLGLNCQAQDYSPVAYLLSKSILEYSPRYGEKLADDVKTFANKVIDATNSEIGHLYSRPQTELLAYLWAWVIRCPYCRQRFPLLNHSWIVRTDTKKIAIKIVQAKILDFDCKLVIDPTTSEGNLYTQKAGKAICINCRNSISYDAISSDIAEHKDSVLLGVVTKLAKGKGYEVASSEDKLRIEQASDMLAKEWEVFESEGLVPHDRIRPGHRREDHLRHYGITEWYQYFKPRQLLMMLTLVKNIKSTCSTIADREYRKVISTFLAFMVCKHVDSNSLGSRWVANRETIGGSLAFKTPIFAFNHAECNPFEKVSGSLGYIVESIVDGIRFAASCQGEAKTRLGSVLHLGESYQNCIDLIITDPPYLDDVPYGELGDFFYVWLRRVLEDVYEELPASGQVEEDISVAWGRFGDKNLAFEFYAKALLEAFRQIHIAMKNDGLLVLFFAHSSTEAWNLLLQVLRDSQFRVTSSYAVHTESVSNVLALGKTSFMSSIVVSCRKLQLEKHAFFEDLVPRIEDKMRQLLRNLATEELLSIPITDLLIMAYGKVLEETTQFSTLKSYKANFQPDFESLIKDAREFILREIVLKITGRAPNVLGSKMSYYVVTKVFYNGLLSGDEAIKIARAYELTIENLEREEVVTKENGDVRLQYYWEREFKHRPEQIERDNLHEQLLFLEGLAEKDGIAAVKRTISANSNFRVNDLKQIIDILIKSARLNLNKEIKIGDFERRELPVLESLADIFGNSPGFRRDNLDGFMK